MAISGKISDMSKTNRSEIESAAKLSRIELDNNGIDSITQDFGSILDFVETIQKADTEGVVPTSQVTGLNDVWREDEVTKSEVNPEVLIKAAPETKDGYIKVKKVL